MARNTLAKGSPMRRILWCSCCITLWMLCVACEAPAQQDNAMRAPRPSQQAEHAVTPAPEGSLPAVGLEAFLRFFQQVISPVDGARSTMYPTGSAYAQQAIKKHGALLGVVLTAERLMHEGNEDQVAPRIRKYGIWRVYDPVEANDWWWPGSDWIYQPASDRTGRQ